MARCKEFSIVKNIRSGEERGNKMNQEAHDILNSVRIIDLQILRLMSKKKMLESCLYPSGIRYDLYTVQGSPENQL